MTVKEAREAFQEFWDKEPSDEQRAYIEAGVPVPFYAFAVEMSTDQTVSSRLRFSLTLKENPHEQDVDLQVIVDGFGEMFETLTGRRPTYVNGSVERVYDPREWE